jgi:hypothetical protein
MSKLQSAMLLAGFLAFSAAQGQTAATTDTTPAPRQETAKMSHDAAKADKDAIEAKYKAEKEACKSSTGNAKDVCEAQAKGKEEVALAEVDYKQSGTDHDRVKVAEARANAEYDVAKEKCEDMPKDQQEPCKKNAKAKQKSEIAASKK